MPKKHLDAALSVPKYSILHKERKNKQTKYNTADQVVEMQAINFMLMKHSEIFLFWITIDKVFFIQ